MKKIISSLLLLAMSFTFSRAQSIHILHENKDVTNTIIVLPIKKGDSTLIDLSLVNKTAAPITYQVNRTILNPPMNEDCAALYFCTGVQCYTPRSEVTWTPKDTGSSIGAYATLPNGKDTYGIAAHYDACPDECKDLYVLYRVYKTAPGTNDTAYVTIKYTCSTGINEHNALLGSISDAYPNPTSSSFSLNYKLNVGAKSELVIYDITGKKIMDAPLSKNEGVVTMNTSLLSPGVYLYSLLINNQAVQTKRLVITD
ncbi:MAG TPA: T9SS type A sorting domain-containing protein [Bacteroidia bacterium]|jgi:hypothetical protein|nr:T9SS type A sorting domain-containing protein [Bacteroidia bacterium]